MNNKKILPYAIGLVVFAVVAYGAFLSGGIKNQNAAMIQRSMIKKNPPPFYDDFSALTYPVEKCFADGIKFGSWTSIYNGSNINDPNVCTKIEKGPPNILSEYPPVSTKPSSQETHASLVTGPSYSGSMTFETKFTTIKQLRTNYPPEPWEMGWIFWDYTDDTHFYYFVLKTNGWELGKEDPLYPDNQRFLKTGSDKTFPVGTPHTVKIVQVARSASTLITVYVDGAQITQFTDTERPYKSGNIGLYNEDAHVHFQSVRVTQP